MQRWGPVSPHGVGTAVGFLAGAMLMARRAEPRGIPRAEVYNAVTWGAVGALIGARGFYVLAHIHQFTNVRDVVAVWQGGLTMFGGFLGGLVLGLWYLRRKGFAIVPALDAAAPGFALGVLIGRVGDIIIADHLGRLTNFFLGYRIPNAKLAPGYGPPTYVPGAIVHHTALYDFAGTLVLLGFLFLLERRRPRTGSLFAAFALWYGVQRFLIDFTRNRTAIESHFYGLSGSQWAGLAFAIGGAVALVRLHRRAEVPAAPAPVPVPVPIAEPIGEIVSHEEIPLPTREEAFAAAPESPPPEPIPAPPEPIQSQPEPEPGPILAPPEPIHAPPEPDWAPEPEPAPAPAPPPAPSVAAEPAPEAVLFAQPVAPEAPPAQPADAPDTVAEPPAEPAPEEAEASAPSDTHAGVEPGAAEERPTDEPPEPPARQ